MKIKKKAKAVRVPPLKKSLKVKRKSSDVEEESTVSKALQNVKKVLEKKNKESLEKVSTPNLAESSKTVESGKKKLRYDRQKDPRGIVYLGHIPHGFYEEQMTDYFGQFGKVTRVRVVRSKNTGRSRGYGYVEFLHTDVAKIAAETMNNYLMCGRLLKATYIPPEKQHKGFFAGKTWTQQVYPKVINRNRVTRIRNGKINDEQHARIVQRAKDKLSALEKKLNEKGFDVKFVLKENITV